MISPYLNRRSLLNRTVFAAGASLLASYPVLIERYMVQINRYRIPIPRLPSNFEKFTIVQLTDLHYCFSTPLFHIKKLIQRVNAIARDIVVCTGDYIHEMHTHRQIDRIWPLLSTLTAPSGVLSILGNHDHWADENRSLYWLERSGTSIRHKRRRLERGDQSLWFVGAGDFWEDHESIDHLMAPIPEDECRIVLAHNPDSADTVYRSRFDLMISGHTHGGQVNIPFYGPPLLPVKNKDYSCGLKKSTRDFPVFISRGIGWSLYPIRFNCFPEIAVLELSRCEE
ncbi:MAG: metallophosphoesterase [Chitinivibrionales bacterium]